jgi:Na+-transporting NADH:ubiquinone oxidoreductase subunit F
MSPVAIGAIGLLVVLILITVLMMLVGQSPLSRREVTITLNHTRPLTAKRGARLMTALTGAGWIVPSGCGGTGKCGQCRCIVEGGGSIRRIERTWIDEAGAERGMRLACQVRVKQSMEVVLPSQVRNAKRFTCTVASNRNLAAFTKELDLQLPEEDGFRFRSGSFVMVEIPSHALAYEDLPVDEAFRSDWARFRMQRYRSRVPYPVSCSYSIANSPAQRGLVRLNVRVLYPDTEALEQNAAKDSPRFISQPSAYLFNLQPGDTATISGPFGEFFLEDSEAEIVFVGGGTGMAPLISHLRHLFDTCQTTRRVSLWYGCRNELEIIYQEELKRLAAMHANFTYRIVLSDPDPNGNWTGLRGGLHEALCAFYLVVHPAPHEVVYYLCGPTHMIAAVYDLLQAIGVCAESIHLDEQAVPRHALKRHKLDGITGATSLDPAL